MRRNDWTTKITTVLIPSTGVLLVLFHRLCRLKITPSRPLLSAATPPYLCHVSPVPTIRVHPPPPGVCPRLRVFLALQRRSPLEPYRSLTYLSISLPCARNAPWTIEHFDPFRKRLPPCFVRHAARLHSCSHASACFIIKACRTVTWRALRLFIVFTSNSVRLPSIDGFEVSSCVRPVVDGVRRARERGQTNGLCPRRTRKSSPGTLSERRKNNNAKR